MRILKHNLGMTAIEVMLSMFILALLSIGMLSMVLQGLRCWSKGAGNEAAGSSVTIALQRLAYEIRDARSATVTGSQLVVTFPLVLTDPTTHETAYDAALDDPITRSYYISDGNLVKTVNGATTVLARRVSDIKDIQASGNGVDLTIESAQQLGTTVCTQQATGHITLRNHH